MTTKPQTKSNAKRSAETATRRTGIEHTIKQTGDGWLVVAPALENAEAQTPSCPEPDTAWIDAESQAVVDALEADNQRENDALTADAGNTATVDATADTEASHDAPQAPKPANLRQAAQAVLDAWNNEANRCETDIAYALERPMAMLRIALGERTARTSGTAPRKPREGTKQERVLAMLHRDEGASVHQIAGATGWVLNTVRGFLAGLKKKGITVDSSRSDAKGSHTIYHINAAIEG